MPKSLRHILFVLIFLLSGLTTSAQFQIGLAYNHDRYIRDFTSNHQFGVQYQIFLGKHVSLSNRIMAGSNHNGNFMLHYSAGGFLVERMLRGANGSTYWGNDALYLFLLPFIVPEGINLHFGPENRLISPYIYPASVEYNTFDDKYQWFFFEGGVKFQIIGKSGLTFTPQIGWKSRYTDGKQAFSLGVSIGFTTD